MLMMRSDIDADYISPSSDEAGKEHLFLVRLRLLEAQERGYESRGEGGWTM